MVKEPQVWKETEDWLKQVKVHSERFRTKLSIQVGYAGVSFCTLFTIFHNVQHFVHYL